MNYKKVIENWLREYDDLKLRIDADWILINETKINVGSLSDPFREKTGKTNKFNSEVENIVIEIEKIQERLDKNIRKMKILNEALNKIGYTEKRILELRYIKAKKWNYICEEVNYEYRWCQELKNRGLNQMVKMLFPQNNAQKPLK